MDEEKAGGLVDEGEAGRDADAGEVQPRHTYNPHANSSGLATDNATTAPPVELDSIPPQDDTHLSDEEDNAGDGDGSQPERATTQPRRRNRAEDMMSETGLRLRGMDMDGGAMQLCKKCHAGRKGHKCKQKYQPARQAVVSERRRGKDPDNHVPIFGIAHRRRGQSQHTIHGVFAPFDLREMGGEFETFEHFVKRNTGRKATAKDWNHACEECNGTGGLIMCLGCNIVYHERCIVTKVVSEGLKRNEELVCPQCVQVLSEVSVASTHN